MQRKHFLLFKLKYISIYKKEKRNFSVIQQTIKHEKNH